MRRLLAWILMFPLGTPAAAQALPTEDPVIRKMWDEGMGDRSQVESLAQVLTDSIGPRLTGSPGHQSATEWLRLMYERWGIPARTERYGTWIGWRREHTHVDLIAPRVRTLAGTLLAWSPGTPGPVEGDVVALPEGTTAEAFRAWLPGVRGRFVLVAPAEPTCRPADAWEEHGRPASLARIRQQRSAAQDAWTRRLAAAGRAVIQQLEAAGAAGLVTTRWSDGWGASKIFDAYSGRIPTVHLSCEDYGLVFRLAERNQGPRLRLDARSAVLGEVPVFNVVAELRGRELPDEYVLLGAHLDSWDGASGATDNGTGTVMMMEAARLLRLAYPEPRRTILIGHWGGEEQGLHGSAAFAEDHPEVIQGLQAAFNHDNGTWLIDTIRTLGLSRAGDHITRWLARIPPEFAGHIALDSPGLPTDRGSDHVSFLCHGAPSFRLLSPYGDYRRYTWHTDLDTYDKIAFDELRANATLTAMLAYLASEDPERMPRDRRVLPPGQSWPTCSPAQRSPGR